MMPAGSLTIALQHRSGQVTQARITSTRPDAATRVFIGKTPEQLLATVPLLFTLCGNAQAYAAVQVCRAALGLPNQPSLDAARELLVQLETLREHVWRILLDWPGFIGSQADKSKVAAVLKFDLQCRQCLFHEGRAFGLDSQLALDSVGLTRLLEELAQLLDTAVFAGRQAEFQAIRTEAHLQHWLGENPSIAARLAVFLYQKNWAGIGANPIGCLPDVAGWAWGAEDWAAFVRTPTWQGRCFETTLLNRQLNNPLINALHKQYGNGLITRIMARLVEVASIPAQLNQLLLHIKDGTAQPVNCTADDGVALSPIQAARGLLLHRLVLRQGTVYDYRIVAPTEWNFHPEGVLAQGLRGLTAKNPEALRQQAQVLINAIDPCVQYTLNLNGD